MHRLITTRIRFGDSQHTRDTLKPHGRQCECCKSNHNKQSRPRPHFLCCCICCSNRGDDEEFLEATCGFNFPEATSCVSTLIMGQAYWSGAFWQ
jgi:hypothetical protein